MSIATRTGDKGTTRLFSGEVVPKTDLRPETYGTMDEAGAQMGLAKALATRDDVRAVIHAVQQAFFRLGHELATAPEKAEKVPNRIAGADVEWLDAKVAALEAALPKPTGFVIPGESPAHGALHVARTLVRRTERLAVRMTEAELLHNAEILRYLNRLSDLLWLLAEYEVAQGVEAALSES